MVPSMNRRMRIAALAAALLLFFVPSLVHADALPDVIGEATKLYSAAQADYDNKAFDSACPKFEAALKLTPEHVRTAISLAQCYDKLDKPASALRVLQRAKLLAESRSAQEKVREIAGKITALLPRLPVLRIIVPENVARLPGVTILRGVIRVFPADWGEPIPVNPGTYQIKVSANEGQPWKTTATALMGEPLDVSIPSTWEGMVQSVSPLPSSWRRTAGGVGIGIGAGGLVIGGILGGVAVSQYNESNDGHCDQSNVCNTTGTALRLEAFKLANASTALVIVGGVLLVGGIVLVATAPAPKKGTEPVVQTSVWIGPGSLGLRGQW